MPKTTIVTNDYNGSDRRNGTGDRLLWWITGSLFFCLVAIVSLYANGVNDRIDRVEIRTEKVPAVLEGLKRIDGRLERIERLLDEKK